MINSFLFIFQMLLKFIKFIVEEKEIDFQFLKELGWIEVEGCDVIYKEFKFKNFNQVFGFMICVVFMFEKMDYYLEWFNVYS